MNQRHRLLLAPLAANDLEDIASFIAADNPARAVSFIDELQAHFEAIVGSPAAFPARFDLAPGLRMAVHGRYLIFFRDLADMGAVRVERVLHGARFLPGQF